MQSIRKFKKILVVDDEPYNIMGLSYIIKNAIKQTYPTMPESCIIIETAHNGLEALKKVKSSYYENDYSYGLIFMDCSMPIMDGYESTDLIRSFIK